MKAPAPVRPPRRRHTPVAPNGGQWVVVRGVRRSTATRPADPECDVCGCWKPGRTCDTCLTWAERTAVLASWIQLVA